MLWRKQEEKISKWINNSNKALLITGARQIGKTYLIRNILKQEKQDYVEFNLIEQPEIINVLKATEMFDINILISRLTALTSHPLIKGKTIIFLDEIQEYKEILTAIKFLVAEGSFKYILSGSLLGVELRDLRSAPVGSLNIINMYPMDFEEFLIANGLNRSILELLQSNFTNKTKVDEVIHKRILNAFYTYLVVGGMPEAVQSYVDHQDFNQVMQIHQSIIPLYKQDFTKYEDENKKLHLTNTYDLIPAELNSKNKRYNMSDLNKNQKFRDIQDSFLWLKNAGVAIPVYNTTELVVPLQINKKSNLFKLFLSDTGMLCSIYGRSTIIRILSEEKDINCGAIYENVVAQELLAHGYNCYYYNNKKQGELDFVIERNNEVLPIEVKSGKDYTKHSALNNVLKNHNDISNAFVFCNDNIQTLDSITYYPIYMIMFLKESDIPLPVGKNLDLSSL